jgi:hypothetical protein
MSKSFESMGALTTQGLIMIGQGEPQRLEAATVTADFFPTMQSKPVLGRIFTPDEDDPGAAGTAIVSYRLWQSEFGG